MALEGCSHFSTCNVVSVSEQKAHFISVYVRFVFLSASHQKWCGNRALFKKKKNGYNPLLGRSLKSHGNGPHRSGISANVFFPRELLKVRLLFLIQLLKEILEYMVTEYPQNRDESLHRFKRKGIHP